VDIEVIDNFLDKDSFENIKNTMMGNDFPWFYAPTKTKGYDFDNNFQFVHIFYRDNMANSKYLNMLSPIVDILDPLSLVKIKANLTAKTDEIIEYGYHTDYETDTKLHTAVYYVNTNNGYTKFESGRIIESKENRLVIFDSQLPHSGTSCTDERLRVLINLNFYKKKTHQG